ncbi:hypothetical protein F5Y19DRAFT_425389 [Xylariaceae sp. FL1651]|nr:hypothetical protein F5Y19DRAFT_425389 [Xylariaceae sp. FL1651]
MRRIDPEELITDTGVYGDLWERKPLSPNASDWRTRDIRDRTANPTVALFYDAGKRAIVMREKFYVILCHNSCPTSGPRKPYPNFR